MLLLLLLLLLFKCCKFHPNGNYIATGSCDRSVRLWDMLNGQCVRLFTGHKVQQISTYEPSNRPFLGPPVSQCPDYSETSLWKKINLPTKDSRKLQHSVQNSPPKEDTLLTIGRNGWYYSERGCLISGLVSLYHFPSLFLQQGAVLALNFSPDGKYLASSGKGVLIREVSSFQGWNDYWDILSIQRTFWTQNMFGTTCRVVVLEVILYRIFVGRFVLFWGCPSLAIELNFRESRLKLLKLFMLKSWPKSLSILAQILPKSHSILAQILPKFHSGVDQRILVWDIASASQVIELKGHTSTVYQLAFSRDSTLLASGGMDNCINLWDATNFEELAKSMNSSKGCVCC